MKRIFALSTLVLVAVACGQVTPAATPTLSDTPPTTPDGVIKGYGISPLGFPEDYSKFPEFLAEIGKIPNGGVMFNGAWRQDVAGGSDAGQIPSTAVNVVIQADVYGYTPIIVFGWRTEESLHVSVPANPANNWTNTEAKTLFEEMLVAFAQGYHPPYVFLGNESDAYFMQNPEDYARWVEFYNRAYDAIKAVSPETMVGPIFQYERISGQGTFNQWITPQWGALEAHDMNRVDIVGFTVYPWLSVATPEEIPDDYLAPMVEHVGGKPVAFTESGWPGAFLGQETAWEASPEAQLRFIDALDRILGGVNLKILNWLHYYQMTQLDDLLFWQAFSSISLRDTEGNKRPVYDAWVAYQP